MPTISPFLPSCSFALTSGSMASPHDLQSMTCDHQLFVGRDDIEPDPAVATGDFLPVRGIGNGIEDGTEPSQPLRDPCTEPDGILADSCREHEGVDPAQGCGHHSGMQSDAIDEMIKRKRSTRITAPFEQAYIIAAPRQSLQTAFTVKEVLHLGECHALLAQKMQHHARIELSWPRPHRQSVQRREAERAVDAPPLANGA